MPAGHFIHGDPFRYSFRFCRTMQVQRSRSRTRPRICIRHATTKNRPANYHACRNIESGSILARARARARAFCSLSRPNGTLGALLRTLERFANGNSSQQAIHAGFTYGNICSNTARTGIPSNRRGQLRSRDFFSPRPFCGRVHFFRFSPAARLR